VVVVVHDGRGRGRRIRIVSRVGRGGVRCGGNGWWEWERARTGDLAEVVEDRSCSATIKIHPSGPSITQRWSEANATRNTGRFLANWARGRCDGDRFYEGCCAQGTQKPSSNPHVHAVLLAQWRCSEQLLQHGGRVGQSTRNCCCSWNVLDSHVEGKGVYCSGWARRCRDSD
jgi:hypothetical protein